MSDIKSISTITQLLTDIHFKLQDTFVLRNMLQLTFRLCCPHICLLVINLRILHFFYFLIFISQYHVNFNIKVYYLRISEKSYFNLHANCKTRSSLEFLYNTTYTNLILRTLISKLLIENIGKGNITYFSFVCCSFFKS